MAWEELQTYLERFSPRWLGAWGCCVTNDSMQLALEENQHAVHDAHDEMGWTSQLSNRCYQHKTKFGGYIFRCPIHSFNIFYIYGCLSLLSTTPDSFIYVVVHLLFSSETCIV